MAKLFRVRHQKIFYLKRDDPLPTVFPDVNLSLLNVNADNVGRIADFRQPEITTKFEQLLAERQVGLYAEVDGRIVGHLWAHICRQGHCRANGYFDLHSGQALLHNGRVDEPFRGKGIFTAMLVALCWQLFIKINVKLIYVDSAADNAASLAGIAQAGFKPYGTGHFYQFRGRLLFKRIEYAA